ncbi:hypothetical protein SUDANB120_02388 [Streptomyces sp. enrichment culture]
MCPSRPAPAPSLGAYVAIEGAPFPAHPHRTRRRRVRSWRSMASPARLHPQSPSSGVHVAIGGVPSPPAPAVAVVGCVRSDRGRPQPACTRTRRRRVRTWRSGAARSPGQGASVGQGRACRRGFGAAVHLARGGLLPPPVPPGLPDSPCLSGAGRSVKGGRRPSRSDATAGSALEGPARPGNNRTARDARPPAPSRSLYHSAAPDAAAPHLTPAPPARPPARRPPPGSRPTPPHSAARPPARAPPAPPPAPAPTHPPPPM